MNDVREPSPPEDAAAWRVLEIYEKRNLHQGMTFLDAQVIVDAVREEDRKRGSSEHSSP